MSLKSISLLAWCIKCMVWLQIRTRLWGKGLSYLHMVQQWNSYSGQAFLLEKCLQKGLRDIRQLYCNGELKCCQQISEQFEINILAVNGLIAAIPAYLRNLATSNEETAESREPQIKEVICQITTLKRYSLLNFNRSIVYDKFLKWCNLFQIEYDDFLLEFKYINIVSNVAKLRSFQYRLLNLAIITNVDLYCWNVRQSEQCSFCSQARETVAHLFFECYTIQELWRSISDLIMDLFKGSPNVTMKSIMFNSILDDRSHVANLICLLVKQYIYHQRCLDKPIRFSECKNIIFNTRNTEKYIAVKMERSKSIWSSGLYPKMKVTIAQVMRLKNLFKNTCICCNMS